MAAISGDYREGVVGTRYLILINVAGSHQRAIIKVNALVKKSVHIVIGAVFGTVVAVVESSTVSFAKLDPSSQPLT